MDMANSLFLSTVVLAACLALAAAQWTPGTASFYGGPDGSGTMGGACGYGNLNNAGYGLLNTALSQTLFNNGVSCGQCYTITCDTSQPGGHYCKPGGTSIAVSATNLCPPNSNGGWCGSGSPHFEMSQPAFEYIGSVQAGVIPVQYQRVQCKRSGGVRFSISGFNYFVIVNIQNLGGSGSVGAASVKGDKTGWIEMSRNWGANWQPITGVGLVGQALSFAVRSTGGQYIQFLNAAPAWWQFGQTYSTNQQFAY
ncbi:unnamed protein product [Urochloa decumbens]|uniref:Expansin n=1 Tax=Urochloa decumbens TaxID=240449 RepID=A0ABC8WXD1_9POAL